ncbi:MAG: hypothetical protein ACYTAF_09300 [Planctomycetota bacterium]|jgi:hypothetical protein
MDCRKCGGELPDGARVCGSCGALVNASVEEEVQRLIDGGEALGASELYQKETGKPLPMDLLHLGMLQKAPKRPDPVRAPRADVNMEEVEEEFRRLMREGKAIEAGEYYLAKTGRPAPLDLMESESKKTPTLRGIGGPSKVMPSPPPIVPERGEEDGRTLDEQVRDLFEAGKPLEAMELYEWKTGKKMDPKLLEPGEFEKVFGKSEEEEPAGLMTASFEEVDIEEVEAETVRLIEAGKPFEAKEFYERKTGKKIDEEMLLAGMFESGYADRQKEDEEVEPPPPPPERTAGVFEEAAIVEDHGVVQDLSFSPDGALLVSAGLEKGARLWHVPGLEEAATLLDEWTHCADFSPTRNVVAVGGRKTMIRILDAETGEQVAELSRWSEPHIKSVRFHPNGNLLAAGDSGGKVLLWDIASSRPVARLKGPRCPTARLSFSPDGRLLASSGEMNTVAVWDMTYGARVGTFTANPGERYCLSSLMFRPRGREAVTRGWDGTIRLLDIRTGDQIRTVVKYSHPFVSLAIDPTGRIAAAGSGDSTIVVWDIATGKNLGVMVGHRHPPHVLAFSADGKYLASGCHRDDHSLRLWRYRG